MVCNTANVFLKKFFQLNHIVNLLQVIFKCIVNYIIYSGCITAKTIRILCAVSRHVPRKQLGTKRYLLDSDLSGPVVPTLSRHVITHGLTKGNSIGVEIGTV